MNTRAYIRLSGDDRIALLQGILTQDVAKLDDAGIQFAALLSPQGKLLHDMLLVAHGDSILIDTQAAYKDVLLKRLAMYKLRAKVTITDVSDAWHLVLGTADGLPDPRHAGLPARLYVATGGDTVGANEYDATRVALGIPEFGVDILPDTMTAMDAGYDLLQAISFTKGCYVGQEVTARMHYKAIARKGFFMVSSLEKLVNGASLTVNGRAVGTLSSTQGTRALAFLKFDDAVGATAHVDSHVASITAPHWMEPKIALFENAAKNQ